VAHEDVEHDHNLVIVEDCSTSWSSDDDDRLTTNSFDKMDDDDLSVANEEFTINTLGDHIDGSCSDGYCNTTTSPSLHCFMSQGDTKVQDANVVDRVDSYHELVGRLSSMIVSLENEKDKVVRTGACKRDASGHSGRCCCPFQFFLLRRGPVKATECFRLAAAMPNSARYGTTCIASHRHLPLTTTLWRGCSERKGEKGGKQMRRRPA
jgi:hypothetical protein